MCKSSFVVTMVTFTIKIVNFQYALWLSCINISERDSEKYLSSVICLITQVIDRYIRLGKASVLPVTTTLAHSLPHRRISGLVCIDYSLVDIVCCWVLQSWLGSVVMAWVPTHWDHYFVRFLEQKNISRLNNVEAENMRDTDTSLLWTIYLFAVPCSNRTSLKHPVRVHDTLRTQCIS